MALFCCGSEETGGIAGRAATGTGPGVTARVAGEKCALPSTSRTGCTNGLGEATAAVAAADPLRTASSGPAEARRIPFVAGAAAGVAVVCGAGESAESPRPPTWMVIFLDDTGVSVACPTLSLILGCDGSGTAALACLISRRNVFCRQS